MMESGLRPRRIVIVGAGFSGTALALNLLRQASPQPLRIWLVDADTPGRGVAYAQRAHPFLLNVPAGRMSATSGQPEQFLAFARRFHADATAEDFLPRELYGQYLQSLLQEALRGAPPGIDLQIVRGRVTSLRHEPSSGISQLGLADGGELIADEVVLALGNPPPSRLRGTESMRDSPAYVENPWAAPLRFRRGETVLVVGTGLTMADIVTGAIADTEGWITVHALSRHGLLPRSQTEFGHGQFQAELRPLFDAASRSVLQLLRQVRGLARQFEADGGDWREVVTFIRSQAHELWPRLPEPEKRRFLRHLQSWWDVHRHRLPRRTLGRLEDLQRANRMSIHAGRITALLPEGTGVRVTWRPRGAGRTQSLRVDRVINCTGPDYDCRRSRDPLTRALITQGVAAPCSLGLGLRTTPQGALLDAQGHKVTGIWYVGPMLRPQYWECTAVPELRIHAERLAQQLAGNLAPELPRERAWHAGTSLA